MSPPTPETTDDREMEDGSSDGRSRTVADERGSADSTTDGSKADDQIELLARIERLEVENNRLRTEYARARQAKHRRTAIALVIVGSLAVLGGVAFPDTREILVAIGATGVFGGILTYYLAPDRFVAAAVGEHVTATAATNAAAISTALGLREEFVYLPGGDAAASRVYVPQYPEYEPPAIDDGPFVTDPDARGLLLEAAGDGLVREFERSVSGTASSNPATLAVQLADALVEGLELVDRADPDVDDGRITVAVAGSAFGPVDRFDHPVASFLAVGVARALETPVTLEVAEREGDEWLITCRWAEEASGSVR